MIKRARTFLMALFGLPLLFGAGGAQLSSFDVIAPKGMVSESCPDYSWPQAEGATQYQVSFDFPAHLGGCTGDPGIPPGVPVHIAGFKGSKTFKPNDGCNAGKCSLTCSDGTCTLYHKVVPGYIHRPKQCNGTTVEFSWSVAAMKGGNKIAQSPVTRFEWDGSQPCLP